MKLKRAISYHELASKKFKTMDLEGAFLDLIGKPERTGAWIIYGESGNGKTRFSLQLAKELAKFSRIGYNSIEEGAKLTFQRAIMETNLKPIARRFTIIPGDNLIELKQRLNRDKSPNIIFIDSIQYLTDGSEQHRNITHLEYKELISRFPTKLFIFISHADKGEPRGAVAKAIKYDADVKIRVEGYKAFAISRYGGNEAFTIWQEGADKYWQTPDAQAVNY